MEYNAISNSSVDNFSSTKFFKISIAFIANLLDSYKGQALHVVILVTSLKLKGLCLFFCPRRRSCSIVSVGNGFGQPLGVVAVSCGVTSGGDDADEVVKEPIFQTTSKKVLRSSEKQKPRAYRTHSMSGLKVFSGLRLARSLSVSFENYIGYGLLLMKEVLLMN